jgi:hypothetical protein
MALTAFRRTALSFALLASLPSAAFAADPQVFTVDDLMRRMAETLAGAQAFSVHVEKTFDDVLVTGPKLQYSGAMDIEIRRPDRFNISYGDDLSAKEAWYNGERLVVLDLRSGVYGELPSEPTIEATLDAVAEKYDVRMPLGELFSSDLYKTFSEGVDQTRYVGLHDVDGVPAYHVWFDSETTQFQFWIDSGEVPLPLKVVITYVDEPGEPQTTYVFSEWDLTADLPDDLFEPEIPEGAVLASFLPGSGD